MPGLHTNCSLDDLGKVQYSPQLSLILLTKIQIHVCDHCQRNAPATVVEVHPVAVSVVHDGSELDRSVSADGRKFVLTICVH